MNNTNDLQAKLTAQTTLIKERFDSLGVKFSGVQQTGGFISSSPSGVGGSYFYHPDHLGSSSLITNGSGDLVQHIQYVPAVYPDVSGVKCLLRKGTPLGARPTSLTAKSKTKRLASVTTVRGIMTLERVCG